MSAIDYLRFRGNYIIIFDRLGQSKEAVSFTQLSSVNLLKTISKRRANYKLPRNRLLAVLVYLRTMLICELANSIIKQQVKR